MPPTQPAPRIVEPVDDLPREQLQREYVSGGQYAWVDPRLHSLPWTLDELQSDFGADVYDRMAVDSQVYACLTVLKASIVEDGLRLTSSVTDTEQDGFDLAKEIAAEALPMLDALEVPLDDVLWDMLNGVIYGYAIAEQRFDLRKGVSKKNKKRDMLQLAALKVKPRTAVAFVVDAFLNVIGLAAARPGQGFTPLLAGLKPEDLLPRTKFAILTFRPKNGDPRGSSILRAAFDPWWRKRQTHIELLKYLTQFASPSIWATAPEKAKYMSREEPDPNNPGEMRRVTATIEEALLAGLMGFKNGTVAAFPFGTVLNTIQSSGEGRAFFAAISQADRDITRAMLTQELATTTGQFQTRAASQVHQDVLNTIVKTGKMMLARMLVRDVLTPWIRYNWGDEAVQLCPKLGFGEVEASDRPVLINAIANLYRAGYLDDSQLLALDDSLGLPERDPESLLEPDQPVVLPGAPPAPPTGNDNPPKPDDQKPPAGGNEGQGGRGPAKLHKGSLEPPEELSDDATPEAVRDYWNHHAPRRYRSLIDAKAE